MSLRLVDDGGLPDFTMRRLATALGVQPSAISWYYPNRQSLLAELADRIIASIRRGDHVGEWTGRLRAEAVALREALLAYRDGAEIVPARWLSGSDPTSVRLASSTPLG